MDLAVTGAANFGDEPLAEHIMLATGTTKETRTVVARLSAGEGTDAADMLPAHLKRNESELVAIRRIAESGHDRPVLMMNINGYKPEAGYPDGDPYRRYIAALERVLKSLDAKILWRLPVAGQPVGEQTRVDEIIAIYYPSHRAFLDFGGAPGADESYRLRVSCVERAVIHRCDPTSEAGAPSASVG
jgi:hypothetical protein